RVGEAAVELVVGIELVDFVLPAEDLQLGVVVRDERLELRVPAGTGEGRQHGRLRDPAEPDHRVADRPGLVVPSIALSRALFRGHDELLLWPLRSPPASPMPFRVAGNGTCSYAWHEADAWHE